MTKHFIFILLLLLTQPAFAQKNHLAGRPPQPPTRHEAEVEAKNHECVKRHPYNFSQRLQNYPFNTAAQIQLVSFPEVVDTVPNSFRLGLDSLPRMHDTVCYSKLTEVKNLSFVQVDKLTDILYNYGFAGPIHIMDMAQCFMPRNAILFLDTAGRVFGFIEVCFECGELKPGSADIATGSMCNQKMDMLKAFFKRVGIEYGVTKGINN